MSPDLAALPKLRRIVTRHNSDGKSEVGIDTTVSAESFPVYNVDIGTIWVADGVPSKDNNLDVDGASRTIDGVVAKGSAACLHTDLPPRTIVPMHRTGSVDFNILVTGELILITENGEEKHLKNPGDCVIQKGTLHGWRNPTDSWTRWVTVTLDAEPAIGADGQPLPDVV